jgi:hypothetical protein
MLEGNIKMYSREKGCENVNLTDVAVVKMWDFVIIMKKVKFPLQKGIL